MEDFEALRRRIEREGRWISRVVWLIFGLTFIGIVATVGIGVYASATLEPTDIGRFFGEIAAGYNEATP